MWGRLLRVPSTHSPQMKPVDTEWGRSCKSSRPEQSSNCTWYNCQSQPAAKRPHLLPSSLELWMPHVLFKVILCLLIGQEFFFSTHFWFLKSQVSGYQSVVLGPATLPSAGNGLRKQILRSCSRPTEAPYLGVEGSSLCNKASAWCRCARNVSYYGKRSRGPLNINTPKRNKKFFLQEASKLSESF